MRMMWSQVCRCMDAMQRNAKHGIAGEQLKGFELRRRISNGEEAPELTRARRSRHAPRCNTVGNHNANVDKRLRRKQDVA